MHKFSVYNFTDKEIDQICDLLKKYSQADCFAPVDKRRYTKQVIDYALSWNLLEIRNNRTYVARSGSIYYIGSVPIEALWRIVRSEILTQKINGYHTITNSRGWNTLNIYSASERNFSERDLAEMIQILNHLMIHRYIYFQYGGSIWEASIREKAA